MEIIKTFPKNNKYRFIHTCCCEFIADESEFKWTKGQYNEIVADVICPCCGKQFYTEPTLVVDVDLELDKILHR